MNDETLFSLLGAPGAATALVAAESGERTSFERLAAEVDGIARSLSAAGVRRGDRVALVLADGPLFVRHLLAVTALGAAAAP